MAVDSPHGAAIMRRFDGFNEATARWPWIGTPAGSPRSQAACFNEATARWPWIATCRSRSFQAFEATLQRGHGSMAVDSSLEWVNIHTGYQLQRGHGSMAVDRPLQPIPPPTPALGFNEATARWPWIGPCTSPPSSRRCLLQRGHGSMAVDRKMILRNGLAHVPLQRGHGSMAVDSFEPAGESARLELRFNEATARWPWIDGVREHRVYHRVSASTRPRLDGRG